MIQIIEKPNKTFIGQDRETLTFKVLLYLNVAVHAQACRTALCGAYPIVQLGYPAITNIFVVSNGNRTEWSPIQSVIIRVITKSDDRAAGSPICLSRV